MHELTPIAPPVERPDPLLSVRDLHYRYPDGTQALSGIRLTIAAGERIAPAINWSRTCAASSASDPKATLHTAPHCSVRRPVVAVRPRAAAAGRRRVSRPTRRRAHPTSFTDCAR